MRFSSKHTLVQASLKPGSSVFDILSLGGFTRDDFEEVWEDRVKIWATAEHLETLAAAGFSFEPTEDESHANFLAAKQANYKDTKGMNPDWGQYCDYACTTARLRELEANCAYPVELVDLGAASNSNYRIWALTIGSSGPEVLMAGNIHGDETTGGQLLQRWAWETCNDASAHQAEVATRTRTTYLPMFNPDGFERNRRGNASNRDLNRDFPTPTQSDNPSGREAETRAYMNFVSQHNFVTSMMYHGGAIVVNYPWDNCYTSSLVPRPCPPARVTTSSNPGNWDDAAIVDISKAYGDELNRFERCMTSDCLVNGAAWYQITGSLQDYQLYHKGSIDVTLEVSQIKRPSASQLPGFYDRNHEAMYEYMIWAANQDSK